MPVIRNHYSYSLLLFIRSVFVRCSIILFHFHLSFVLIVIQREKNNSEPEPCSGISILRWQLPVPALPVSSKEHYLRLFQHHHLESINIIQQTPPTLS
jgi:hypothetical protein